MKKVKVKKEVKRNRAKIYADLSIQFYRDRRGRGNMLITKNKTEGNLFNTLDEYVFASCLEKCPSLNADEKNTLMTVFSYGKFKNVHTRIKDELLKASIAENGEMNIPYIRVHNALRIINGIL